MSKVNFYLEIKRSELSILKVSEGIISSLRLLMNHDDLFKTIHFLHKRSTTSIDVADENSAIILAANILEYSLPDIKKYDAKVLPDINYSRPYGFTFGLLFKKYEKKLLALTFKLGSNSKNTIGTLSIDKNYRNDFSWYMSILDSFVLTHSVEYASVRPDDLTFLEQSLRDYKYVFGWITYFVNDIDLLIPDNLDGIEYKFTDKGKYLILTREDFTLDKSNYEVYKQKLLNIMMEIKRREPKYSK
jgi:hypothetical protein